MMLFELMILYGYAGIECIRKTKVNQLNTSVGKGRGGRGMRGKRGERGERGK